MKELEQFNQVTFAVPGRRFAIDSFVTTQDRLPIVIEFALRLVRLLGEVSLNEFQGYFGFNDRETATLLEALQAQRLVELTGEQLTITSYAASRFEESSDELPRFTAVEPRSDLVDFELLSYSPVSAFNAPNTLRNLIEVSFGSGGMIANSNQRAERAFYDQFGEIVRKGKLQGASKVDVYKVSHVEARKDFFLPVPMRIRLDDDNGYVREPEAANGDTPASFWDALSERVPDLVPVDATAQRPHLKAFADHFGDKVLPQFLGLSGFKFADYIERVHEERAVEYGQDTEPIFGNLYLPRNRAKVIEWMRVAVGRVGPNTRLMSPALWFAPDYSWWGRTGLLEDACREFGESALSPGAPESLLLAIQADARDPLHIENRFRGTSISNIHLFVTEGTFGGRIEILFVPTRLACVLFHVSVPGAQNMWAPAGFLSTNPARIEAARQVLQGALKKQNYIRRLQRKSDGDRPLHAYDESFGLLNYVAIADSGKGYQPLVG